MVSENRRSWDWKVGGPKRETKRVCRYKLNTSKAVHRKWTVFRNESGRYSRIFTSENGPFNLSLTLFLVNTLNWGPKLKSSFERPVISNRIRFFNFSGVGSGGASIFGQIFVSKIFRIKAANERWASWSARTLFKSQNSYIFIRYFKYKCGNGVVLWVIWLFPNHNNEWIFGANKGLFVNYFKHFFSH